MTAAGHWACALALVSTLAVTGCSTNSHPAAAPDCADLVSAGATNARGDMTSFAFIFVNGSGSTCSLRAPAVSPIGDSGAALAIPQDSANGAQDAALQLAPNQAGAIPYTISSLSCLQTVRFDHVVARFSGGANLQIPSAGELCPGSRITVSAPVTAVSCEDGSFRWVASNSGLKPTC